jgi:hypothetical protein
MRPKRYPLDPLVRVRRDRVDTQVKALSMAVHTREEAERARLAAEADRARRTVEAEQVRAGEQSALARGELSAVDLQRQGAWEARTQWDDEERGRRVATARESEAAARGSEGDARAHLATAEANAKVVTEHRAKWVQEGEKAAEVAAEEGAAEAWRPRR